HAQALVPWCKEAVTAAQWRRPLAPWRSFQIKIQFPEVHLVPWRSIQGEKLHPNHPYLRHAPSCGAMAQVTEKFLPNWLSFAPCAILWSHGAAYRGLELPSLAQLRHAQHSCAMAQLEFKFSLFYLCSTQPSIRLLFHSL
ncbi:hypothetical protein L195_g054911, partial [Trifolium pratense]